MTSGAQFEYLALGSDYAGFTIDFYEAGTTTAKDVWVDEGKSTSVHQIRADSKGTATWYADGMYRMKVLDADGVLLYDWDNVRANTYISHTNPSTLYSTLNEAISTIGSDETDLYITQQIVMDANLVVPSNIRLHIIKGGSINQVTYTLTINGQIDAGLYQIFDGTGTVTFGTGSVKEVYPEWFGADGTDDSTAITTAFNSLASGSTIKFTPSMTYDINATIRITVHPYSIVDAYGATFTGTLDDEWFVLNDSADPANTGVGLIRNFRWFGGSFVASGTKTASVALQVFDFRGIEITDTHIQGFWKGIEYSVADTARFDNNYFYNNTHAIYMPDWATNGMNSLSTIINNNHFSITGGTSGITVLSQWANLYISECSFNGALASGGNAILISNAGTGGVSAIAPPNLVIEKNHFEQGTTGNIYIYLRDDASSANYPFLNVTIADNTFSHADVTAIKLERVIGIKISNNRFAQSGVGETVLYDENCTKIDFDDSNYLLTAHTQPKFNGTIQVYGIKTYIPFDNAATPVVSTNPFKFFGYNKSKADDTVITLPNVITSGYGIVIVGTKEEYTQFFVDNDGDITLLNNTANVVANADTDTKLCIGTAATQEPLQIKNRLGATKVINIMFWYD